MSAHLAIACLYTFEPLGPLGPELLLVATGTSSKGLRPSRSELLDIMTPLQGLCLITLNDKELLPCTSQSENILHLSYDLLGSWKLLLAAPSVAGDWGWNTEKAGRLFQLMLRFVEWRRGRVSGQEAGPSAIAVTQKVWSSGLLTCGGLFCITFAWHIVHVYLPLKLRGCGHPPKWEEVQDSQEVSELGGKGRRSGVFRPYLFTLPNLSLAYPQSLAFSTCEMGK